MSFGDWPVPVPADLFAAGVLPILRERAGHDPTPAEVVREVRTSVVRDGELRAAGGLPIETWQTCQDIAHRLAWLVTALEAPQAMSSGRGVALDLAEVAFTAGDAGPVVGLALDLARAA